MLHVSGLHNAPCDNKILLDNPKKVNLSKLKALANTVNWNQCLSFSHPDTAVRCLVEGLTNVVRLSEYTVCYKSKYKNIKPWMTNAILVSIRRRDKLKKALKTDSSQHMIC